MIVNSTVLDHAAETIRKKGRPQLIPAERVRVSASQCRTAARLLREAKPSICNGIRDERPGFIERERQDDPTVLTFSIGILPSTEYRIDRRGRILGTKPARDESRSVQNAEQDR